MTGHAGNPLVVGTDLIAPIRFTGRIVMSRSRRSLEIDLYLSEFPAFEAYACINDGAPTTLIEAPPPKGNTVLDLATHGSGPGSGSNSSGRHYRLTTADADGDGVFDMTLANLIENDPPQDLGLPTP